MSRKSKSLQRAQGREDYVAKRRSRSVGAPDFAKIKLQLALKPDSKSSYAWLALSVDPPTYGASKVPWKIYNGAGGSAEYGL